MMSSKQTSLDLELFIQSLRHMGEEDLLFLNRMVVERLNLLAQAKSTVKLAQFAEGDRVQITESDGCVNQGVVLRLNKTHAAPGHRRGVETRCVFRSTGAQAMNRPTTTMKALIAEALVDMASSVGQMKTAAETPKRWARALACRALICRRPLNISLTTDCVPSSDARSACFRSCCSMRKRST
jgi:hypothetical protein